MPWSKAWILVAVLVGVSSTAAEAQVAVALRWNGNALRTDGDRPTDLAPGERLSVRIAGDSLPTDFASSWEFSLDGTALDRVTSGVPQDVRAAYTILAPATESDVYTLSFRDEVDAVTFPDIQFGVADDDRPQGRATLAPTGSEQCRRPGYDRKNNEIVLAFFDNGLPTGPLPKDIDDNDVIHICLNIPADEESGSFMVQVEGTIRDQSVNVLGEGSLQDISGVIQSSAEGPRELHLYGTYGPFSPPSITVSIGKSTDEEAVRRSHVLRINSTYVAALHYAVGVSNIRFNEFGLTPVPGSDPEAEAIRNRSDSDEEARSLLLVGFYGWPWDDDFWHGRDLEETSRGLGKRLGPMVGIGLDDIFEEFVFGVTLEVTKGLFVFGGRHLARTDRLQAGFTEKEPLTVTLESVPIEDDWKTDFIWGVSVDLRIAAKGLSGILGSP